MAFHSAQAALNQGKPFVGDVSPVLLKSLEKVEMRTKERQRHRTLRQRDFSKKEKHSVFFHPTDSINNSSERVPQRSCEEPLNSKKETKPGLSYQSLQNSREQGTSTELHYLASTWPHPTQTPTLCVDASSNTVSVKNKETSTEYTRLDSPPRDSDRQHTTALAQEEPKKILSPTVILSFSLPEPSVSMIVPMSSPSQRFIHVADIGADGLADLPLTGVTNKSAGLSSPLSLPSSMLHHSVASSPTTPHHSLASPSAAQRYSTMLPPTILHSLPTSTPTTLYTSKTSTLARWHSSTVTTPATLHSPRTSSPPAMRHSSTTSTPATLHSPRTSSPPAMRHSSTTSTPATLHSPRTSSPPAIRHSSTTSAPAMQHSSTASAPATLHSPKTSSPPAMICSSTISPHVAPQKSEAFSTPLVAPNEDDKCLSDAQRVITHSENHNLLGLGDFDWKLQQDDAWCGLPDQPDALLCPLENSRGLSQAALRLLDMDTQLTALQCAADGMQQDLHSSRKLVHTLEGLEKVLPPKSSYPAPVSHQAGGYGENCRPSSGPAAAGGFTPRLSLSLSDVSSITSHSHKPVSSDSRELYPENIRFKNRKFNGLSDIISDMVEDESKDVSGLDLVHSSHHTSSSMLQVTSPFQTHSPEKRSPAVQQELQAWMRRKRCERMAEFHCRRNVLLEQEHKPFVAQASTTVKKIERLQQDKGERDRHRLAESSRMRTMQAGELLLELMENHVGETPAPPSSVTIGSEPVLHKRSKLPFTTSRSLYPARSVQNNVSRARSASRGQVHPVPNTSRVPSTSEFKNGGTHIKLDNLDGAQNWENNGKSNLQGAVNQSDEDINESDLSDWIVPENIRCILMETESSIPAVSAPPSPNERGLQSPQAQPSYSTASSFSQIDWESVDEFIAGLED
uniref:ciliogenesis and planar polarity effector 1-like n=1 Tax=Myxine glutinosa TaxID=7769 RepID=UPI00358F8373